MQELQDGRRGFGFGQGLIQDILSVFCSFVTTCVIVVVALERIAIAITIAVAAYTGRNLVVLKRVATIVAIDVAADAVPIAAVGGTGPIAAVAVAASWRWLI